MIMKIESLSYTYRDELYHHGIKGMKWGVRRFQNEDGSLTSAGRRHYGYGNSTGPTRDYGAKAKNRTVLKALGDKNGSEQSTNKRSNTPSDEEKAARRKKALKVGAAVAATAIVAIGAYNASQYIKDNKKYFREYEDLVAKTIGEHAADVWKSAPDNEYAGIQNRAFQEGIRSNFKSNQRAYAKERRIANQINKASEKRRTKEFKDAEKSWKENSKKRPGSLNGMISDPNARAFQRLYDRNGGYSSQEFNSMFNAQVSRELKKKWPKGKISLYAN